MSTHRDLIDAQLTYLQPWYCRKCESQERSARVRCELCPSRDGALKKTDNQGWAHVVCALYIPEVRFGNVSTMEPIILQLIPPERYNKCKTHTRSSPTGFSLHLFFSSDSVLHLCGWRKRFEGNSRCLHAMQQIRLQAAVPRDVRSTAWPAVRGGRQLLGQRQVLRLLSAPLQQIGEFDGRWVHTDHLSLILCSRKRAVM